MDQAQETTVDETEQRERQIVEDVRAANPGLSAVELFTAYLPNIDQLFVFRGANRAQHRIFRQMQADGKKLDAQDMLVNSCVVFPAKDELARKLDKYPVAIEPLTGEILEVSGLDLNVRRKKY
jgi:hypothetical protein